MLKLIKLSILLALSLFLVTYSHKTKVLLNNPIIYVNFNQANTEKRLYIKQGNRVIYTTWVAHGTGSGMGKYAVRFSNENNSHASSLGKYRLLSVYKGQHGISIRLQGLSNTNSNAYKRSIVIHSASYIGHGKTGHSWGCFAVTPEAMQYILRHTAPGTYLIAYK